MIFIRISRKCTFYIHEDDIFFMHLKIFLCSPILILNEIVPKCDLAVGALAYEMKHREVFLFCMLFMKSTSLFFPYCEAICHESKINKKRS